MAAGRRKRRNKVGRGAASKRRSSSPLHDGSSYDVFVSYAHRDETLVADLARELRRRGLRVWTDDTDIEDFSSISDGVVAGLQRSKALLAVYSTTYPHRPACQFELTAAYIAAQRIGDPRDRVLVVNPDADPDHVDPMELRDAKYLIPGNGVPPDAIAAAVVKRVGGLKGPLGRSPSPTPPTWLPAPRADSPRFVGRRSDLWRLHSALHAPDTPLVSTRTMAISHVRGLGGIGKSMLAEEYARKFSAAFPGGIFWLTASADTDEGLLNTAERDAQRHQQLRLFAERLGAGVQGLSPEAVVGRLTDALRTASAAYLWVVDDLPIGVAPDEVRSWFAPTGHGRTLLISRGDVAGVPLALHLDALSEEDGFALLTARRQPDGAEERAAAFDIVEQLGGHPQALEIAGAALWVQGGLVSFAEASAGLSRPTHDELELAAALADELPNGHEKSIAATLARSINALDDAGLDLLRLAASISSGPIAVELVAKVIARADRVGDADARLVAARSVSSAERQSLIRMTGTGHFTVHALVSRAVRFADQQRSRRDVLRRAAIEVLDAELASALAQRQAHALPTELLEHARQLAAGAAERSELELLVSVALCDLERGDYAAAVEGCRHAHARARLIAGDDDALTLNALHSLATALNAAGDLAGARRLQERMLSTLNRNPSPAVLGAANNLGDTLRKIGDLDAARRVQEEVLRAAAKVGVDPMQRNQFLANLALTLQEQGELETALTLGQQVLEEREAKLGPHHVDTYRAKNNLSLTLHRLGRLDEAETMAREAADGWAALLGPDHQDSMLAIANLALVLVDLGERVQAEQLQRSVVDKARARLGEDHPLTIGFSEALAVTWGKLDRLDESEVLLREVARRRQETLGPDNRRTWTAFHSLAVTLENLGRNTEAAQILGDLVVRSGQVLGPSHTETVAFIRSLAELLSKLGDDRTARPLFEKVVDAFRTQHGLADARTLRAMEQLAATVYHAGDFESARRLRTEIVEAGRRTLGPEAPETLVMENQLGVTLLALGDLSGAEAIHRRTLEVSSRVNGEEDAATLTAKANLASVLFARQDFTGAKTLEEEVQRVRERTLGRAHPSTLWIGYQLAHTLLHLGEFHEAATLSRCVWKNSVETFGPEHRRTLKALDRLLNSLRLIGDIESARQALDEQGALLGKPELAEEILPKLAGDVADARTQPRRPGSP